MTKKSSNPHVGSSFEDFLKEEGFYEEATATAIKRILAWQIEQAMQEQNLTKSQMAQLMNTSRSSLDNLLNPDNPSVTLQTLQRAASVLGKQLRVEIVD